MTITARTAAERVADAEAWLVELLGNAEDGGSVRLAMMKPGSGWSELSGFRCGSEPFVGSKQAEMLHQLACAVVKASDDGNDVYACPYLHSGDMRRKGNAVARHHVHADVDGPLDLDCVRLLGGMAVASGSVDAATGKPHGHVYVRLIESVAVDVHEALCRALGRRVGGRFHDPSKATDDNVLRPPGTLNYKHRGDASPVSWLISPEDSSVRTWAPSELAAELGLHWPPSSLESPPNQPPRALDGPLESGQVPGILGDPPRDTDAYTAVMVAGIVADLDSSASWPVTHRDARGRGWEKLQADSAYRLARLALADWSTLTMEEAEVTFLAHAPIDGQWTARDRAAKWSAQRRRAEQRGPLDLPHDDLAGLEIVLADDDDGRPLALHSTRKGQTAGEVKMTDDETADAEFWEARPLLVAVRDFARARRVAPWALLGAVLARVAAAVPPTVVLPPTRGSVASLNLFVGLVGESGSGKSAAMDAAREFLDVVGGCDFLETSPGSGEGLLTAYVWTKTGKGEAPKVVQHRVSVLLDVDEVGALGALAARTNSTLLPFLKTAWSGRTLATENAEVARRRKVEAHRYRLAVVCGIQPANAGLILDDVAGGFPQRFLWMPTYDAGMLPYRAEAPRARVWQWRVPAAEIVIDQTGAIIWTRRQTMQLPPEAVSAILAAAEAHNRPIGSPAPAEGLDGHALLTRAKVAALLALLDGRVEEVSSSDWLLAGAVMAVSDRTRVEVTRARAAESSRANRARGKAEGIRQAVAAETADGFAVQRAGRWILRHLRRASEPVAGADLRKAAASRDRRHVDEALGALVQSGQVLAADRDYRGQPGRVYRLADAEGRAA